MAGACLIFSVVDAGILSPKALSRSAAAAMERSCCEVIEIWQWVGYRCHMSEKQRHQLAGI
jgi:hypothetical protein